ANARVRNLVENEELWFVPTMNPDGYMLNRRGNSRGVDLNRNFPEGTLGQPNTITGREQETANIMQWTWAHSFTLSVGYHGGALVVNYPFDNDGHGSTFSPTPDEDMFVYISEEYSRYNPPMWNGAGGFYHGITNGAAWYSISGGMQDWHYRYEGCNDVTIEVSLSKSPPWSQIPTFWNENRDSMLAWMETALIGVRGLVTDSRTNRPLDATVSVVGRNHPIYTDPDVGDYHRMLLPGTYQLRFEATGYDPVIRPVTVTAGPATRLDVRLGPGWLRGDMNCDDVVNFDDINPFVLALSNPAGYAAAYPQCDIMNGDVNGDGRVDFDDINPFVALLAGTH
ncbi:MAG: M14 family zinc carboxypeptidase, partial [Planctomycetota bacterium]